MGQKEIKKPAAATTDPGSPAAEGSCTANLGVEFLKCLARQENDQKRLEICKASGIMDTLFEKVGRLMESINTVIEEVKDEGSSGNSVIGKINKKLKKEQDDTNKRKWGIKFW